MNDLVSIIIPSTIGGFEHLARLMPTLSQEPNCEIIIVDNHSMDGTTNYLANYQCTVIINKVNEGFAKANNKAVRIAQGDYLLFLNNDTVIEPGFVTKMHDTFAINDQIAVVGCCIYTLDSNREIQHAGVMFTDDYLPYELGKEIPSIAPAIPLNDPRIPAIREVPSVTAACMMVKKAVFNEVGGFDEAYWCGWEDNDLVLRIREQGYKVWYNGQAIVYHKKFGSVNAGRFAKEVENRTRYDNTWVHTGRAKKVLGEFRNG